jgi:hypothetical protein
MAFEGTFIRLHEPGTQFFTSDFIYGSLKKSGFEKVEIIERDPYPGVEFQSRRA